MMIRECEKERVVCKAQLCLRPARERRHAWKARRTLCMFICRTAIYPTFFCKIQKPTSATPNKRWTDVAATHLSHCLIHSSLPTNPSLPLLTQQDDICFHAWCMRLYLTVQPRVRLHVLRLLNLFLEPSSIITRRCLRFHGAVLSGMNLKVIQEDFTCTETHD